MLPVCLYRGVFFQPPLPGNVRKILFLNSFQGCPYIEVRIDRNAAVALFLSLLVHVLALFLLGLLDLLNPDRPKAQPPQPITVHLNTHQSHPVAPPVAMTEPVSPPPPVRPLPRRKPPVPVERTPEEPKIPITTGTEPIIPSAPVPPKPATSAPAPLDPGRFPDMASYLNAVREKRRMSGEDAASVNEEAIARERERSEEAASNASLRRNPPPSGTNGIFQILSMDNRTATFAFRGWKNEFSYSHREVYQVEAGQNGDIGRAVIRKMIEIIRRYYDGDFNWDSYRLGRVVVLSARLQDNSGLEDFLMQEFFGSRGISAQ